MKKNLVKKLTKQERIELAKKELNKTLHRTGYLAYLARYGSSTRPPFPDISVPDHPIPTSDNILHSSGKKTLPKDAKQFNVQSPHKQGYMLHVPFDGTEHIGGKKS